MGVHEETETASIMVKVLKRDEAEVLAAVAGVRGAILIMGVDERIKHIRALIDRAEDAAKSDSNDAEITSLWNVVHAVHDLIR